MPYLDVICLDMPDDFPAAEYCEFVHLARRVTTPDKEQVPAWKELGGASNLIAWRFRASAEAWREHKASLERGTNNHQEYYEQECSLFMMFVAGVSCMESATYAMAAAASHPQVCGIQFDAAMQRKCSPSSARDWLVGHDKAASLVSALDRLSKSSEWRLWISLRNRMTHRSNLPRRHYASVGGPPPVVKPLNYAPTSSTPDIDSDYSDWDAMHEWLAHQLRYMLKGGSEMLTASL